MWDSMMEDIDIPFSGSYMELPFYSKGKVDSSTNHNQNISATGGFSQIRNNCRNRKNISDDEKLFYDSKDTANSGFLNGNFLNEREDGFFLKKKPYRIDGSSVNYLNIENFEKPDFTFESPFLQKKRTSTRTLGKSNNSGADAQFYKPQTKENDNGFIIPHWTWYPTVGSFDASHVTNQPTWSCFITEDEKETHSLRSEESTSSTTVKGETIKKPSLRSMGRQNRRRHGTGDRIPVHEYGEKNTYAEGTQYESTSKNAGQHAKMSTPSHFFNPTFQRKLDSNSSWFFEEESPAFDSDSDLSSSCQASLNKKPSIPGTKLWTEDSLGAYAICESQDNAQSSFERSKYNAPAACSPESSVEKSRITIPTGCFPHESLLSGKLAFCQPFSCVGSHQDARKYAPTCSPDLEFDSISEPQEPLHAFGCPMDIGDPNTLEEENIIKNGERKLVVKPNNSHDLELWDYVSHERNGLCSHEDAKSMNASHFEGDCNKSKEERNVALELKGLEVKSSQKKTEATQLAMDITDKFEGHVSEKEYQNDLNTSLPNQNGWKDDSGFMRKERGSKGADTSCQVMTRERYILQLLCVQVLKEAHVTKNKVDDA